MTSEAERRALLFDSDLFFSVRVTETIGRAGYVTKTVRRLDDFSEALREQAPHVAFVNMSARGVDWRSAIAAAHKSGVPIIAYGPHVEIEAQTEARRAGATTVVSNSQLVGDMPAIVERALRRTERRSAAPSQAAIDERAASAHTLATIDPIEKP